MSHSTVQEGEGALAAAIALQPALFADHASLAAPLCADGSAINVAGYTLSAWVYLSGPEFDWSVTLNATAWGPTETQNAVLLWGNDMHPGEWHHVEATFTDRALANHVAIHLNPDGADWRGTLYVDSVELTGP